MTAAFAPLREAGRPCADRRRRWIAKGGTQTAELRRLIERARAGEPLADIATQFYPTSPYGIRKVSQVFARYGGLEAQADRKRALIGRHFNRLGKGGRPRGPLYVSAGSMNEPALTREAADLWAGLGTCFA